MIKYRDDYEYIAEFKDDRDQLLEDMYEDDYMDEILTKHYDDFDELDDEGFALS